MPGPLVAAVAGGVGSALIGANASNKAAKAQTKAADQSLRLQSDMFNRMDELQGGLYDAQTGTIQQNTRGAQDTARNAYDIATSQATGLRDGGQVQAQRAFSGNTALNSNALRDNSARTMDSQWDTVSDANANYSRGMAQSKNAFDKTNARTLNNQWDTLGETNTNYSRGMQQSKNAFDKSTARTLDAQYDTFRDTNANYSRGMAQAGQARDANIGDFTRERSEGTKQIWRDRAENLNTYDTEKDASLGYFEPSIGRGNDAGAAYAYNLGLGSKPKGYTGLQESEGTKYLMNTGRQEIEGGAAGAGGLYSGATMAALEKKRQGLASLDKDNQMNQMMSLAGLGQGAANSAAGIRAGYADDVAATRSGATAGINALRAGYTGQIADERGVYRDTALGLGGAQLAGNTNARNLGTATLNSLQDDYRNNQIGLGGAQLAGNTAARNLGTATLNNNQGDYRDTALGLGSERFAGNTNARNLGTASMNALRDQYATRGMGINNAYQAAQYGMGQDYANGVTNAADTLAGRRTDAYNTNTANLGAARSNRAALMGQSAANYTTGASSALANRGDAKAAGAIGGANAMLGGVQNGMGIYGMLGGGFGGQTSPAAQGAGTGQPWTNPFANMGSWFGR